MKLKKILCTAVSTVMIMSLCAVNVSANYQDTYGDGTSIFLDCASDLKAYMQDHPEWTMTNKQISLSNADGFVVDCDMDFSDLNGQLQIYSDLVINEGCTLNVSNAEAYVIMSGKNITNYGTLKCSGFGTAGSGIEQSSKITNYGKMYFTGSENVFSFENNGTFEIENDGIIFCKSSNLIKQYGDAANIGTGTGIILTTDGKLTYCSGYNDGEIFEHGKVPAESGIGVWQGRIGNINSYPTDETQTGDTDMTMSGKAIAVPTYTVTIPKNVSFGTQKKTTASKIVTTSATISADGVSNLFANQQKLMVTVESANSFNVTDGILDTSNVPYDFFTSYTDTDKTKLGTDKTVLSLVGTATNDENLTAEKECTLALDTKNISKAGNFSDTLTFTITLESVGD